MFCYGKYVLFWMPGAHSDSLGQILRRAQVLRRIGRIVRIVIILHGRSGLVAHDHIAFYAIWSRPGHPVGVLNNRGRRSSDGGDRAEESLISIVARDADLLAALIEELNGNGRVDSLL